MAIQADGKIVLGGFLDQAVRSMEVARLTTAGQRDTTFGANNDGRFYYQNAGFSTLITDIAIDAQQRIVFGGKLTASTGNLLVGRLTAGGALDLTFDGTGYGAYQGLAPTNDQTVSALALTADSIFVASYAQRQSGPAGCNYFQVNRYNNDGTPASDFGIDGGAYSTFGDNTQTDAPGSLIVTTSGVVVLGSSKVSDAFQFGIARLQNGHIFSNSFE